MFFFDTNFYIAIVILQAICVIHCVRKGNQQKWIWLIVFLPLIGSIVYFFSEIFTNREMRSVQSGVGEMFNPSGTIRKLEDNLRFSDTFNNRIALADAYLKASQPGKAIPLYENSLTGAFAENEYAIKQLIIAYYAEKRYADIVGMTPKIYKQPEFPRSKAHILYAMSLSYTGRDDMAEQEFSGLRGRFSNFEARYYYALFLQKSNRIDEARQLLREITEEIPQLSAAERRFNNQWIGLSKELLKKLP
jgi:hypothetical protein